MVRMSFGMFEGNKKLNHRVNMKIDHQYYVTKIMIPRILKFTNICKILPLCQRNVERAKAPQPPSSGGPALSLVIYGKTLSVETTVLLYL